MSQTNGSTQSPPKAVAKNMGEVLHDLVSLLELQIELFKIDVRDAFKRLAIPVALLLLAAVVAIGTIPVALLCVAAAIAAGGGLPYWLAALIATLLGFGAAAALALTGRRMWLTFLRPFDRSRDEFQRNLKWIKRVLARREETP